MANYINGKNMLIASISGSALIDTSVPDIKLIDRYVKLTANIISATTNATGTEIILTFNKEMASPVGKHAEFSFTKNGTPRAFQAAILGNNFISIILTVSGEPIAGGDIILLNYVRGTISGVDTGPLESISNLPVGNIMPSSSFVYAVKNGDDAVSKLRLVDMTVVATISVGDQPYHIAKTSDNLYAYVTNGNGTVSKIRLSDNVVVATISVGITAYAIAITPDNLYAYVTNINGSSISLVKIRLSDNAVASVPISPVGTMVRGIVISPDGLYAYLSTYYYGVKILRLSDDVIVATISIGTPSTADPRGIAITPDGLYVYVANFYNGINQLVKIRLSDNTVIATITVQNRPYGVAISPNGLSVYVTNFESSSISKILVSDNSVVNIPNLGSALNPHCIVITADGLYAYITNANGTVSQLQLSDDTWVTIGWVGNGSSNTYGLTLA